MAWSMVTLDEHLGSVSARYAWQIYLLHQYSYFSYGIYFILLGILKAGIIKHTLGIKTNLILIPNLILKLFSGIRLDPT